MIRSLLFLVAPLACAACAVPHPVPPNNGETNVGADYTSEAVGHWICPGSDIVVANHDGSWLLHDLNSDWVTRDMKESGDGRVFRIVVGSMVFNYRVPSDPKSPLVEEVVNTHKTSECAPAPMPTFIRRGGDR